MTSQPRTKIDLKTLKEHLPAHSKLFDQVAEKQASEQKYRSDNGLPEKEGK